MARYSATTSPITTGAGQADTTALTSNTYIGILGGTSTMRLNISEVYAGGEATAASAPQILVFARNSTIATTPAAGGTRNAATDAASTAPGTLATVYGSAATGPQRSSTLHLLHLSFNAYGGIVRWQARQGEEISMVGNAATGGDSTLSPYTGNTSGNISAHVLYELV